MKKKNFIAGIGSYINDLRAESRYSTAKSYQDASRSFMRFCGLKEIPYTYINKDTLRRYQAYLIELGCSLNTVSTYMRRLRCIYNRAVDAGEASFIPHLFKGVFTGVESKRKKALPGEEIGRLMTARPEEVAVEELQETRLAFCLMFAFGGMAFVDFVHLKKADIKGDVLTYHRQKTGTPMRVEILPAARPLLEELCGKTAPESPLLFPFLDGKCEGEAAYREYNRALARFNRDLRELKELTGVSSAVTSYTIRHSFATTLKERGVPVEEISELLGHASIKTTQIYLKSFSLEKLTAVNKSCFESVYNYVPKVG